MTRRGMMPADDEKIQPETGNDAERPAPASGHFTLSLVQVERINRYRRQYMGLYVAWFVLQTYLLFTTNANEPFGTRIYVLGLIGMVGLAVFYLRFIPVLRAMGYPFYLWLPACLLALLPVPGILVVAFLDRTMGRALNKGLAAAGLAPGPRSNQHASTERDSTEGKTRANESGV